MLGATASAIAIAASAWSAPARGETPDEVAAAIMQLRREVAGQAARLAEQDRILTEQRALLERQADEIDRLQALSDVVLQTTRGAGSPAAGAPPPLLLAQAPANAGPEPVGEAPPPPPPAEVAAVPEGYGVLTPRGETLFEPSVEYVHGSTNRLVFRGVEIVTGIQIGVIEASDADRNTTSVGLGVRHGLTDRLEIEARLPYLYREDRITTLAQREETATRSYSLVGQGLGDLEFGARYQLNGGRNGWPIFLAGLRVKSDTGTGPFDVRRDAAGIATELATGSGFWGVEGSLSFLYPTDPAVIFGGINYLSHQPKNIDREIGGVLVGKVDPGDSIGLNAGFGFALNPRFSFSLGYKHSYIDPTKSVLGGTPQQSESLNVGAFTFGWSYALNRRVTISNAYEIGTTNDAPDMRIVLRFPVRF